ncbi:sugar ABC transporter substrate-binding protein [Microbacterium stercoris]|uniref:ABC transporter substrate-binding protein n=1 Tax=Microbacterium stercoris TaxID=2820289 RepID=A0A939QPJ2_9MICO|nr:ABC transporter substrate-binding protein [Microbacterium stercoris]MBO3662588.1 ABC transporter substrate-binding protein [Microbacterium stercoris]
MRRNRTLMTVAALAAAPLILASCSGGGANGGGDAGGEVDSLTMLDYWNNEPDKTIMQGVIDDCAEEIGVEIERETVPGKDLIQKVLQRSSSKTLPDILMLDNPDVQEIAATGGLAPLSRFEVDTDGFAQGILDAATYEDEIYGLAPAVNTLGIFYNKTLLDEAGIEPPKTWDDLKAASAALTEGDRYGVAFSAIATYEGAWQFLPFMWTNGGDETDLQTPEVAEALQLWVDLVKDGSASEGVVNWSQADVKDQFVAGKAAMMVNGPWQIPALADTDFEWGSVLVPVNEEGQTPVAPLGGEVLTVPETGDEARQAKAAEFIGCITNEDNSMAVAEARFMVPTRTDLVDAYVEKVPSMEAFTQQVVDARSRTGKLGEEWPTVATVIYNAVQLAITGEAEPAEALEQAARG